MAAHRVMAFALAPPRNPKSRREPNYKPNYKPWDTANSVSLGLGVRRKVEGALAPVPVPNPPFSPVRALPSALAAEAFTLAP